MTIDTCDRDSHFLNATLINEICSMGFFLNCILLLLLPLNLFLYHFLCYESAVFDLVCKFPVGPTCLYYYKI